LVAVAVALALALASGESHAEQFVLFDATFTYTWDMAVNARPSKSHYYVNEGNWLNKQRPANWMSPVNYRDGKVHIRAEVLEKPAGTRQAGWALCYVANVGGYGCPYTDYYTKVGVYERDADMHTFYNNTTLQWDKGVKQVDLVYTINGSGSGHITNFPNLKDLTTPTKVRITMVQVSAGSTYDPSILGMVGPTPAPEGTRDSGATDDGGGNSPGASPDSGTPPDPDPTVTGTGGSSGSGTGGAAGSMPAGTGGATGTGGAGAPSLGGPVSGGCAVGASGRAGESTLGSLLALGLLSLLTRTIGRGSRRDELAGRGVSGARRCG
jgi:hypothetical protein